ncbi:hypothetical protein FNW52_18650 [Flavobacterium sp. ZT3R18]|uniref:hypothetical protein n=1 Tax=Flavobacterium sp. ZT3R18 TaxID=2594429 RepID=UPI00117B0C4B|nr:hypothetical protein [Flavobacterium sp. ZT3R18]TRX31238.1 hypothetical protein FNW52_18650 [Flavobacterium sp. ZT3R18]
MKNKLYIAGLVLIAVLTYSCSNDEDNYDVQGVKTKEFNTPQSVLKNELTAKGVDSTAVKMTEEDGDPINPIPPR